MLYVVSVCKCSVGYEERKQERELPAEWEKNKEQNYFGEENEY